MITMWALHSQYGQGLPKAIRDVVFKKRYQDGHRLSDRIWNLAAVSEREILGRVQQAMATGQSAVELSRSVREFLLKPGPAWTTAIKPSVTGRGSLAYNALRLARTEINQAYHMGHKMQAQNSPLVIGVKWNLSGSHPRNWPPSAEYMGYPEICDYRAEHDHHGLGPGIFPKDNVPEDHPNGLCFLTDVLAPPEYLPSLIDWQDQKDAGDISDKELKKLQETILKEIAGGTGITTITPPAPPLPSGPQYPAEIAGVKQGQPMNHQAANENRPNPKFNEATGYRINCQSCVVTYEARLRGYDVETLPNKRGSMLDKLSRDTNLAWLDPHLGTKPDFIQDDSVTTYKKAVSWLDTTVKQGQRYTLQFIWGGRGSSGHIISAFRDAQGTLTLYDPQTGEHYTGTQIDSLMSMIKYTTTRGGRKFWIGPKLQRVDDKAFNLDVVNQIMKGAGT